MPGQVRFCVHLGDQVSVEVGEDARGWLCWAVGPGPSMRDVVGVRHGWQSAELTRDCQRLIEVMFTTQSSAPELPTTPDGVVKQTTDASYGRLVPRPRAMEAQSMIPVKTSVEDIEKILNYLAKQIGFTTITKAETTLGSLDSRKLGALVEFGLVTRDGANIKVTDRGAKFASGDQAGALKETVSEVELYHATLEWVHYGERSELTATEIGQYWEAKHSATIASAKGDTLKNGAVCFGRVVEGAGLGALTIGRGGNETRVAFDLPAVTSVLHPMPVAPIPEEGDLATPSSAPTNDSESLVPPAGAATQVRPVEVSASPSVHVNVEIHIAADAKADTVREIFKNMARYVLNKPTSDDDN